MRANSLIYTFVEKALSTVSADLVEHFIDSLVLAGAPIELGRYRPLHGRVRKTVLAEPHLLAVAGHIHTPLLHGEFLLFSDTDPGSFLQSLLAQVELMFQVRVILRLDVPVQGVSNLVHFLLGFNILHRIPVVRIGRWVHFSCNFGVHVL